MIIQMQILMILFSLSKTQNYMFLLKLYQQEVIKNNQNFLVQDSKNQFIGMNIKQKVGMIIREINIDIPSN